MEHIYDLVRKHAGRNPDKPALSDLHGVMTYKELDHRSAALAAKLVSVGVEPGSSVGVYVPYVKEIALGGISAVRAGGVYMPMDDTYPKERLEFMLKDADAQALLTLHALWDHAPLDFPLERVVFMDEDHEGSFTVSDRPMDESAFILYTSGTTGRPKGVVHTHRMMVSFLAWARIHEGTEVTESSITGAMTGFTFIGSTEMIYAALCANATACIAPEAARKDLKLLKEFIEREHITHIFMPSGLAATFVEYCDTKDLCIFAGGEKMRNFRARSDRSVLVNSYGATELGGVISIRVHGNEKDIPAGRLAADTRAMVLDENGQKVPDGNPGELLVCNDRMARFYMNLPELTAKNFVILEGERWFRTGDRAKRSSSGVFHILGRTDNMVKLRGFRIETGEVEAQLTKAAASLHMDVKNLVVVLRTVHGIDHLTCYYESEAEVDTEALSAKAGQSLASYMVPDLYVQVLAMPRNANGKIIRSELPQPTIRISDPGILYNEAEARVVTLCALVLNIQTYISPDDSFSSLGGTSLKAMELAELLCRTGIFISGSEILRLDKLRDIAKGAQIHYENFWTGDEYRRIRMDFASRRERIRKVLPLTKEQDELLFEQIMHPDDPKLRKVYMVDIAAKIEEYDLCEVADQLTEEMEELCAAIVFHGVTTFQQVITDRKIPVSVKEIADDDRAGLRWIYHRLHHRPADLQRESMIQIVCAHHGSSSYLFLLDHMGSVRLETDRRLMLRMLELLGERYPENASIFDWFEMMKVAGIKRKERTEEKENSKFLLEAAAKQHLQEMPLIHTYSEGHGKKIVFVHTGNTGSEAYYNLAERIRKDHSFAVIEPFNLYHPEEAAYGINSIAKRYVQILKEYQPEGPYILGGWCYGGVVAYEMASQLQASGEQVECLFMMDAHVIDEKEVRDAAILMHQEIDRKYFETSHLFAGMKRKGMLEDLIENSAHVSQDMLNYVPSGYDGACCYFRPETIPVASVGSAGEEYWRKMTYEHDAGGFENYLDPAQLVITETPHEHDLMMDDASLDVIVPEMYKALSQ